ncbi:MAG TPA: DUF4178 domain-containing protein [Nevskia sp.]|nr:DUF4178 domain-containing protein [Nevskia sp.]
MAVCEFCKTTVLKDADSVKDVGKMSDVLADYSPIQIGTAGKFGGQNFTVIGRIQLRYSAGLWNEWYLLFDDGKDAWLGDSSGLFVLTTERPGGTGLPAFERLSVGRPCTIGGKPYIAAEIRTADCIGGQGELPFRVGEGWQARVADFRSGDSFVTLDYSDGETPKVYAGQAVTLEALQCQLLREDDQVLASAGKFRGKVSPLSCPSCGSSVSYVPGMTSHLVCPSCQAQIDTSGAVAQVLEAGDRMAAIHTTLELGAKATIAGTPYELIGLMRRSDDEGSAWTEYLLHSTRAGFLWLVETDDGWARAKVQDDWPTWSSDSARLGGNTFRKLYDYPARVQFAAGAFNWRVHAGDEVHVTEFESGQNKLAAEMTSEELTWSMSTPVAADQIRAWFGESVKADKHAANHGKLSDTARKFIVGILAINAIPLMMAFGRTWLFVVLAIAAVYFPAKYLDSQDD